MNRLKIFVLVVLGVAIIFSVSACEEQAPDQERAELRERIDANIAELKDASEDLQEDLQQAEKTDNQGRIRHITEHISALDSLRNELNAKLNEIDTISMRNWPEFKKEVETELDSLTIRIEAMKADFEDMRRPSVYPQ